MNNCPKCGAEFEIGTAFCASCGCNLSKEFIAKPVCPKCRKEYESGVRFCADCGIELVSAENLVPRCRICGQVYEDGTKFCPKDGGEVVVLASAPEVQYTDEETMETAQRLIKEGYQVDIGGLIRRGWEILRPDIVVHIVLLVAIAVVSAIVGSIPLLNIVAGIVIAPLAAGPMIVALKRAQGKTPKFEDGLLGLERFVPLMLVGLTMGVLIFIGSVLLILPGIYLAVSYTLAYPLAIDRNMPFWDALETSRKVIGKKWFPVFGLLFVLGLINCIGAIPMGLGLLVTVPLLTCTVVALYESVFGHSGNLPTKGKVLGSIGLSR